MGKILHRYIFFILEISKVGQMQFNVSLLYDIRWKIEKLLFEVVRNGIRRKFIWAEIWSMIASRNN